MSEHVSGSASGGADFDLTQFYQVFFEEAGENLANMETQLLALDVDSPDDEQLNAIFRCAHSIKGGAATFGFQDVADLTHVMETLLDRLRRHELSLAVGMVDVLLESGDTLRGLLARHQGTSDVLIDASELVARIRAHVTGAAAAAPKAPAPAAPAPAVAPAPAPAAPAVPGERELEVKVGPLDKPEVADQLAELFGEIPGLGTIEALDGGKADEARCRLFKVRTTSTDDELLDLFTFHVARESVAIRPMSQAAAPAAAAPAAAEPDPGYGFFVDVEANKAKLAQANPELKAPAAPRVEVLEAAPAGGKPAPRTPRAATPGANGDRERRGDPDMDLNSNRRCTLARRADGGAKSAARPPTRDDRANPARRLGLPRM